MHVHGKQVAQVKGAGLVVAVVRRGKLRSPWILTRQRRVVVGVLSVFLFSSVRIVVVDVVITVRIRLAFRAFLSWIALASETFLDFVVFLRTAFVIVRRVRVRCCYRLVRVLHRRGPVRVVTILHERVYHRCVVHGLSIGTRPLLRLLLIPCLPHGQFDDRKSVASSCAVVDLVSFTGTHVHHGWCFRF